MKKKGITVLTLLLLLIGLIGCAKKTEINLGKEAPIGKKAPNFTLTDLGGKKFSLSDYLGSKIVILWFTNLCAECRAEAPKLQKIYNEYQKNDMALLAISVLGEDKKSVADFVKDLKITFPFLIDPKGKVCKLYSGKYISGTCPLNNFFIIDKKGLIQYKSYYHGIPEEKLRKNLEKFIFF